jgi:hypothetical protein
MPLCRHLLPALLALAALRAEPPWPAQYKLTADQTARLTAADVVGPDGLVYPDWRLCGAQGGIPNVPERARVAPGNDFAAALEQTAERVAGQGGGAIVLAAGVYHLDRPVTLRANHVVVRGQGRDRTRIVFRYAVPPAGVTFYSPRDGERVPPGAPIELHCAPTNLVKMTIEADGQVLGTYERGVHSGNTFWLRLPWSAASKLSDGPHRLKGVGTYQDGSTKSTEIGIVVDRSRPVPAVANGQVALGFQGAGQTGRQLKLARDGRRGDAVLELESAEGLAAGDFVVLEGPATERWKTLTRNACKWGSYRRNILRVERVDGARVTLAQPLRIEFPVVDGSYVQKVGLVARCGLEDLTIEQTENLWITAAQFTWAVNCWARGVKVVKCGRNPVYGIHAKWCEIRDCVFDDAWYKGGGGTAYGGWEIAYDCLLDGIETFKLRHAPLFQWSASGCVIRRGVFHASDAQWHSGWTNENLFEQCVVDARTGNGSYGYGAWASPPEDNAHGPNGPRNVIYNCDFASPKAGLWMGGMNEAWMVLHNRFVVGQGPGVFAKTVSFDHVVRGNVFVLRDGKSPMVQLQSADCTGVELIGNKLLGGNGQVCAGAAQPLRASDNEALALADAPRPQPAVASIFEWQRRK